MSCHACFFPLHPSFSFIHGHTVPSPLYSSCDMPSKGFAQRSVILLTTTRRLPRRLVSNLFARPYTSLQQSSIRTLTSRQLPSTGFSLNRKLSSWEALRNETLKRLVNDVDVEFAIAAAGIKDDNWLQKLLDLEEEQLILIISFLLNKGNIDNKSIKSDRTELPSFSTTKWRDFAAQAGLSEDPSYLRLQYF